MQSKTDGVCEHEQHKNNVKVEKILKGSLDSIPSTSHSVKLQIIGGKVCLRYEGKTLLGIVNKLLKKNVDNTQQCFTIHKFSRI